MGCHCCCGEDEVALVDCGCGESQLEMGVCCCWKSCVGFGVVVGIQVGRVEVGKGDLVSVVGDVTLLASCLPLDLHIRAIQGRGWVVLPEHIVATLRGDPTVQLR